MRCGRSIYTNLHPKPALIPTYSGADLIAIQNATDWRDVCEQGLTGIVERQLFWQFSVNDVIYHEIGFGTLTTPFPIGTGSTYEQLLLTNQNDIVTYLQTQGVTIVANDVVGVRILAINCNGLAGKDASNLIQFVNNATVTQLALLNGYNNTAMTVDGTGSIGTGFRVVIRRASTDIETTAIMTNPNAIPYTTTLQNGDEIALQASADGFTTFDEDSHVIPTPGFSFF